MECRLELRGGEGGATTKPVLASVGWGQLGHQLVRDSSGASEHRDTRLREKTVVSDHKMNGNRVEIIERSTNKAYWELIKFIKNLN